MKTVKKVAGLGDRLRKLRSDRKWTQSDISEQLGIVRSTYAYYEIDKTSPDPATMVKIAKIFGVSTDYLLGNFSQSSALLVHDDSKPEYHIDPSKGAANVPGMVSSALEARVLTAFRFLKEEDQQRFLSEMEARVVNINQ